MNLVEQMLQEMQVAGVDQQVRQVPGGDQVREQEMTGTCPC